MIDKEIKCPCGYREYMEEHQCKQTDCNKCCPLTLQDIVNNQQAEIERLSRLVVKEKDKKRIISEIFTRIKKCSFEDTRLIEGGGIEKVSIVFRDDVNKCLRDFLIEWIGDTE